MWDVFISHAWEDKDEIARPLANALSKAGYRVWFDEFTLTLGDSLRRSIDAGLSKSRFGIVILSPNFFTKEWPQRELDGLTAREITSGKIILPIWHNVTRNEIEKYSPILADRLGVSTSEGLDNVLQEVIRVLDSKDIAINPNNDERNTNIFTNRKTKYWLAISPIILVLSLYLLQQTSLFSVFDSPTSTSTTSQESPLPSSTQTKALPTFAVETSTKSIVPTITATSDSRLNLISSIYDYVWETPPNNFQGFQDGDIEIVNDGLLTIDNVFYRTDLLNSRSFAVNFIFRYLTANPSNACEIYFLDESREEALSGDGERIGINFHTIGGLMFFHCTGGYYSNSCDRSFHIEGGDEKFNDFVNITTIIFGDLLGVYYDDNLIALTDIPANNFTKFKSMLFLEDGNTACQYDNIRVWNLDNFRFDE